LLGDIRQVLDGLDRGGGGDGDRGSMSQLCRFSKPLAGFSQVALQAFHGIGRDGVRARGGGEKSFRRKKRTRRGGRRGKGGRREGGGRRREGGGGGGGEVLRGRGGGSRARHGGSC